MKNKLLSIIAGSLSVAVVLLSAEAALSASKVKGKEVEYRDNGTVMKGYVAYNANVREKRPGVIVVHEWWGLNSYIRKRAKMLAELGYTALAVDMYGDGRQAGHPDEARVFSSELMKNFDVAKSRFSAAMDFLKNHPTVDSDRIAAIGYCFGGGVVLNMARQGTDLRGVASFHGGLTAVSPAEPGSIKAKILVFNGEDDTFITAEQVEAFKQEMSTAGADFRFVSYPGAVHGFTNPNADENARKFSLPLAYNPRADRKSWKELKGFLELIFTE